MNFKEYSMKHFRPFLILAAVALLAPVMLTAQNPAA